MDDSTCRTLAGVKLMAFSREQLETILENAPELKEDISGLDALEDDPIPIKLVDEYQSRPAWQKEPTSLASLWVALILP